MNVFLVVPFFGDLPLLASEVEALVNTLQPRRVLQGDVTELRLAAAIKDEVDRAGAFDGFWLATHSSERAVALSDGELSRDALVNYIAQSGAEWVVLNGCESEGLAAGIAAIGCEVLAVAMTEDGSGIKDRDAWRMAATFATALDRTGGDFRAAFESIPQTPYHRYFPAGAAVRAYDNDREVAKTLATLVAKVDMLSQRLDEVIAALDKRPTASQVVGMVFFASVVIMPLVYVFHSLYERGIFP